MKTGRYIPSTWRIIPVSKWLATPIYKPFRTFGRGRTTLLRGLLTMVINHLQVLGWSSKYLGHKSQKNGVLNGCFVDPAAQDQPFASLSDESSTCFAFWMKPSHGNPSQPDSWADKTMSDGHVKLDVFNKGDQHYISIWTTVLTLSTGIHRMIFRTALMMHSDFFWKCFFVCKSSGTNCWRYLQISSLITGPCAAWWLTSLLQSTNWRAWKTGKPRGVQEKLWKHQVREGFGKWFLLTLENLWKEQI